MTHIRITLFLVFLSCHVTADEYYIHVVIHESHSGIVLNRTDISLDYLDNTALFNSAMFIELGYGDKEYYMSPDPGITTGLRALFLPTESVLHVVRLDLSPYLVFPNSRVFRISINDKQRQSLLEYIRHSFLEKNGKVSPVGKSLYLEGSFYDGKDVFHLFNTCNTWVAKALNRAGLELDPFLVITESTLTGKIRKLEKNPD